MNTTKSSVDAEHLSGSLRDVLAGLHSGRREAAMLRVRGMAEEVKLREFEKELRDASGGRVKKRLLADLKREVRTVNSVHVQRFNQEQMMLWGLRETLAGLQVDEGDAAAGPVVECLERGVGLRSRAVENLAKALQLAESIGGLASDTDRMRVLADLDRRRSLLLESNSLIGESEECEAEALRTVSRGLGGSAGTNGKGRNTVIDVSYEPADPAGGEGGALSSLKEIESRLGVVRRELQQEIEKSEAAAHSRIEELEAELSEAREALESEGGKLSTKDQEIEDLAARLEKSDSALGERESEIAELQERLTKAEAALGSVQEERDGALEAMESVIQRLRGGGK